ncbi:MAG: addiction module protein [Burkholderiaceae bacterium]|nr:addiction module protein [Burkholderiaceae bacterium]
MPSNLEVLQAEVLRLSPADRARLLDRLVASPDVDASVEAARDVIADQREQELTSSTLEAVPLEVAVARLEARFPG